MILDEGTSRIAGILQDAHSQLHPTVGLIVAGVGTEPSAVAAILDAGADDCPRDTNPRELAARLVALSRRRAIAADRHPRRAARLDLVDPST